MMMMRWYRSFVDVEVLGADAAAERRDHAS